MIITRKIYCDSYQIILEKCRKTVINHWRSPTFSDQPMFKYPQVVSKFWSLTIFQSPNNRGFGHVPHIFPTCSMAKACSASRVGHAATRIPWKRLKSTGRTVGKNTSGLVKPSRHGGVRFGKWDFQGAPYP